MRFELVGTPLKDESKFTPQWKQTATDDQGRRRFHGAFTGGFSAGYFNTVGSKEGWTPTNYSSSRAQRNTISSTATDYMDEEDLQDFNQKNVTTRNEFEGESQSKIEARLNEQKSGYLQCDLVDDIIIPKVESVGMRILRNMGWKGSKLESVSQKLLEEARKIKDQHRLIELVDLKPKEIENVGIGVGVLQEDDDYQVYDRDDRQNYTKSLDDVEEVKVKKRNVEKEFTDFTVISGFVLSDLKVERKWYKAPVIPKDYVPGYKYRTELKLTKPTYNITERGKLFDEYEEAESTISAEDAKKALNGYMPFKSDREKHERYMSYLQYYGKLCDEPVRFPNHFSRKDIDRELEEFYKAARIFQPVSTAISNRFQSQSSSLVKPNASSKSRPANPVSKSESETATEITREQFIWYPDALLLKRLGLKEPHKLQTQLVKDQSVKESDSKVTLSVPDPLDDIEVAPSRPEMNLFEDIFGDLVEELKPKFVGKKKTQPETKSKEKRRRIAASDLW